MRGRHRTSDLGSSRAVQRLGLVRERLPEERGWFRGGVLVLFFFRRRQRLERSKRQQRRERHQERRQAQVRYLAQKTQERLELWTIIFVSGNREGHGLSVCGRTGFRANGWNRTREIPAPEGRPSLAQRFSAGKSGTNDLSPGGTTEYSRSRAAQSP